MEGIIGGLQSYLGQVKRKTEKETNDYNKLIREREELLQKLADLENDKEKLKQTELEMSRLQDVSLIRLC